ncbi:MAG: phosphate transport system permease protein [Frankiaceae bacterium]|jgi:phosphate transport system permease protein|nr:phosphate transport system permease protein [Frankiaceae bacterium]
MTADASSAGLRSRGLTARTLPRPVVAGAALAAVAVTFLLFAVTPLQGVADFLVAATVLAILTVTGLTLAVEGRRRAVDRLATSGALIALVLTLLPLGFTLGYTAYRGTKRLTGNFLTHSMAGVGPFSPNGGIYHAIVGTLEQVLIASLIAVPLGLLVAIYVTEYGRNAFGTAIRFLVDVMTGIPSIVAGLFVLAFWVLALHKGFSGFAGSIALAILELPIVVRSAEEMIRLVPAALREASYALGVPKWKTILRIVLPTAATGITTGVMLAIARVTGETAPVLLVVGNNFYINTNPMKGPQASLPLYIFQGAGSSSNLDVDRAWAAALTLILIVVVLYVAARLLTRRNSLRR